MKNILGQDAAIRHLRHAVESDRMHHGYIFRGPEGVGKRRFAITLATLLNCSKRSEFEFIEACGTCPSCHKMQTLQHPDLMLIEPTGASNTIKIDSIRQVSKFVRNHPFEARYQIIIINDAHRMTTEASNSLLKTLEEPPPWVRIILVTHRPNRLLNTIRSRGQFVQFKKLSPESLMSLLNKEHGEIDEATKRLAIQLAEGSISRTISFIEEGVLERRNLTFDVLKSLSADHPKSINESAAALLKSKDRLHANEIVDHLQLILRDVAGYQMNVFQTDNELIKKLAANSRFEALSQLKHQVDEAKNMINRNGNTTLVFEWLLTEFADTFRPRN